MNDATLAQGKQVLNLLLQQRVPERQLQELLESGLLSDLLGALNPKGISRGIFKQLIYVSQNAFVPGTHAGTCILMQPMKEAEQEAIDALSDDVSGEKFVKSFDYLFSHVYAENFRNALQRTHGLSMTQVRGVVFNALCDDPDALRTRVMIYVQMVIGTSSLDERDHDNKTWKYRDSNGEVKSIRLDERYMEAVERKLEFSSRERVQEFRHRILMIYGQNHISGKPNYDFMDMEYLVQAVTEVGLASVSDAYSFFTSPGGDEQARERYARLLDATVKQGYCRTCAARILTAFAIGLRE